MQTQMCDTEALTLEPVPAALMQETQCIILCTPASIRADFFSPLVFHLT
jgi:hypothetical protein